MTTSYQIFTTVSELLEVLKPLLLSGQQRFLLVADQNTKELLPLESSLRPYFYVVPAGEACKNISEATKLWQYLLEHQFRKDDLLISFGGGAVTDLVGFVASTYKRGIRLHHIPTTLLAMIDASIGGKCGIDLDDIKNAVGTVYPPEKIWVCPSFIDTLSREECLSGKGELFKYACLIGGEMWNHILDKSIPIDTLIEASIRYKLQVTKEDLHDKGARQLLNLGHTVGHALETLAFHNKRAIPHGIGVVAGIAIESYFAFVINGLPQDQFMSIVRYIQEAFPPVSFQCNDYERVWAYAFQDKKNIRQSRQDPFVICSLLKEIGQGKIGCKINKPLWEEGLDFYRDFFRV